MYNNCLKYQEYKNKPVTIWEKKTQQVNQSSECKCEELYITKPMGKMFTLISLVWLSSLINQFNIYGIIPVKAFMQT